MRVLIFESEPHLGRLMKQWLEDVGYAVCRAGDAASACCEIRAASFDLLLLDASLPPLACRITMQTWRGRGKIRPLLVLGAEEGLPELADGNADRFLAKPFTVDELLAQVGQQLREHSPAKGRPSHLLAPA
jgi:DNA-binding response OmpR family regulator